MKRKQGTKAILKNWERLPILIRAIISGFLVSTIGITVWTVMFLIIKPPWSVIPMIFALWAFWKFFIRKVELSPMNWKWGTIAAIFFVVLVQASFVITFRIKEFPAAQFTSDYKMLNKMPLWIAWIMLIMSSVVAGICEETGFRGYLQIPLEKKYGPVTAIIVTSIIFTFIHLNKNWAHPIIPHIFSASVLLGILAYKSGSLIPGIIGHSILDIFDYSFWWTGIAGGYKKQTIFVTGLDIHFIVWVLIFSLALYIFFRSIANLKPDKEVKFN
jgi:membrane protease YdiL (CAAX protease family)